MSFAWTIKYNLLANLLDTRRQGYHGAIHQGLTWFFEEHTDAGCYCVHADQSRSDELENNKFFKLSQNKRNKLSLNCLASEIWPGLYIWYNSWLFLGFKRVTLRSNMWLLRSAEVCFRTMNRGRRGEKLFLRNEWLY